MTQDQYGQARGPGNVIHGDPVPDQETDEAQTDETKPMTRFQKVASALRGDRPDRDETDRDETDPDQPYPTERDEAAMADTPIYRETEGGMTPTAGDVGPAASRAGEPSAVDTDRTRHDYWDEPGSADRPTDPGTGLPADTAAARDAGVVAMDPDVPVDETHPDVPVDETQAGVPFSETGPDAGHPATEPDTFGTAHADDRTGSAPVVPAVPAAEGQPGAATITDAPPSAFTDVPAGASVETATGAEETAVPDVAAGQPAAAADAAPGDRDLRPGEGEAAAGSPLGDFSDLTYGNLIPDAALYTEQWQQVQFKFVDDPHASVTEAADIVAQVTAKLEAAIQERQRAIEERQRAIQEQQRSLRDRWGEGSNADTENLRATLRMYKTFLDQLIGPRAS
jgi:hypothetical protein